MTLNLIPAVKRLLINLKLSPVRGLCKLKQKDYLRRHSSHSDDNPLGFLLFLLLRPACRRHLVFPSSSTLSTRNSNDI